ncbi:MAG: hypothetical protein QM704_05350 [Anaeromyxobacteraceae bacterium]
MGDRQGQLHLVVKPTRLAVVRDVVVIVLCAVVLTLIAVDLLRGAPTASPVQVHAGTGR